MKNKEYSAGIMSQSFWFSEFKKFLRLMLEENDANIRKKAIIINNLFGAPNEYRAKRMYGYINKRISTLDEDAIKMFFASDLATQKLINLMCIIRQDRLFFEFLYEIYREKIILGEECIGDPDVKVFFHDKEMQSESLAKWKDATKLRVKRSYFTFMLEGNLIKIEGKKKRITPPLLDTALEKYLQTNGETSIIKAISGEF